MKKHLIGLLSAMILFSLSYKVVDFYKCVKNLPTEAEWETASKSKEGKYLWSSSRDNILEDTNDESELSVKPEYFKERQYNASFESLITKLSVGMTKIEVENILGKPDYKAAEGQYEYFGDRLENGKVAGLTLQYKKENNVFILKYISPILFKDE